MIFWTCGAVICFLEQLLFSFVDEIHLKKYNKCIQYWSFVWDEKFVQYGLILLPTSKVNVEINPLNAGGSRPEEASRLGRRVSSRSRWIGGYNLDINTPGCSCDQYVILHYFKFLGISPSLCQNTGPVRICTATVFPRLNQNSSASPRTLPELLFSHPQRKTGGNLPHSSLLEASKSSFDGRWGRSHRPRHPLVTRARAALFRCQMQEYPFPSIDLIPAF